MLAEGGGSARKRHNAMSKKAVSNNLVGRRVLIDWPVRWQGATPENQATLKAEARQKEHYFGEEGEIVAYNPSDESGKALTVVLDKSKEIVHLYDGAVTVKSVSPAEQDHKQIVSLLEQILEAIKLNNNHG